MSWQQSARDCAFIELALRGMAIPLQRASAFELWPEQTSATQREADTCVTISKSAPMTEISLRHEIRK